MDASMFLAKVFGLYLTIASIAMLLNREYYQQAITELVRSSGLRLVTAIFTLILGIIAVMFHNVWNTHWQVIITVLAWLTLVKGALHLICPKSIASIANCFTKCCVYSTAVWLMLILGLYLSYIGFEMNFITYNLKF